MPKSLNYLHFRFLQLANGHRTIDEICSLISIESNLDKVLVKGDIQEYFEELKRDGLIIDKSNIPTAIRKAKSKFLVKYGYPTPSIVHWELTSKCNLACKHCYLSAGQQQSSELDLNECFDVINQVVKVSPYQLEISGGEPLMRKDIFEILRYARENFNGKIKLLTNGLIIDENIAIKLKDLVDFIHISMDGIGSTHDTFRRKVGSFDSVLKAATLFKENGIKFGFSTTIFKDSLPHLEEIAKLAKDYGAERMRYFFLYPFGRGKDSYNHLSLNADDRLIAWKKIVEIKNKYINEFSVDTREGMYGEIRKDVGSLYTNEESYIHCRAGTRIIHIDSKGDVYPCPMVVDQNNMRAGNVREQSLLSICKDEHSFKVFRDLDIDKIEKCGDCSRKIECGGGLRCIALIDYQDISGIDPFCVH